MLIISIGFYGICNEVVGTWLAKGLLEKVDGDLRQGEPMLREERDGHRTTLIATEAGLAAIGIESDDANRTPPGITNAPTEQPAPPPTEPKSAPKAGTPRAETKQEALIPMLCADSGAIIEGIATVL